MAQTNLPAKPWFEIQCLDDQTGRGVPMVELETVNHLRFVTDNSGRVAFYEPGLMGREIFFSVTSHGYEFGKDGFGISGVRLTPRSGARQEIKIKRVNIAERLYRITGEGLYRDSVLLGYSSRLKDALDPGLVAGQDSVQMVQYQGKLFWFYGDTDRMSYPLGHFRTSGATSVPPKNGGLPPSTGIDLQYFTGPDGFSRPMVPLTERSEGVIWTDGQVVVPDSQGRERLVCHYSRRKGLGGQLEHGFAVFNDEKAIFEPVKALPDTETWRHIQGQSTIVEENGARWIYCGVPLLHVRVPARLEAVLDSAQYEAFTCLESGEKSEKPAPHRAADGKLSWGWRHDAPPVVPSQESRWLKDNRIKPEECYFQPKDAASDRHPVMSSGSVRWNPFRQRWIMIAVEVGGGPSMLGEVWYAEAQTPVGPFERAIKIMTHNRQSFYNPCQHDLFDEAGGRFIYFEGTYVNTFSGNPETTPRYNYNQILYKLDLSDPRLKP